MASNSSDSEDFLGFETQSDDTSQRFLNLLAACPPLTTSFVSPPDSQASQAPSTSQEGKSVKILLPRVLFRNNHYVGGSENPGPTNHWEFGLAAMWNLISLLGTPKTPSEPQTLAKLAFNVLCDILRERTDHYDVKKNHIMPTKAKSRVAVGGKRRRSARKGKTSRGRGGRGRESQ